jgi:hypothetical protein
VAGVSKIADDRHRIIAAKSLCMKLPFQYLWSGLARPIQCRLCRNRGFVARIKCLRTYLNFKCQVMPKDIFDRRLGLTDLLESSS